MIRMKPGYRTSEFWFTLVSFIFSGLFLLGIISDHGNKEELISIVSHAVESVILISGQLFIFYRYIKGRNEVKKIVENENLEELKQKRSPVRKTSNATKRTNIKPSTKSNTTSKRVSTKSSKNSTK